MNSLLTRRYAIIAAVLTAGGMIGFALWSFLDDPNGKMIWLADANGGSYSSHSSSPDWAPKWLKSRLLTRTVTSLTLPTDVFFQNSRAVSSPPQLESLTLNDGHLTKPVVAAISALPSLSAFGITRAKVDCDALNELSSGWRLEKLAIHDCALAPSSLAFLTSFRHLRVLEMNGTTLSSADLSPLKSLESLDELSLSGTNVDDEAIPYVTTLKNLQHLDISSTRISRAAIMDIIKANGALLMISAYGMGIDKDFVKEASTFNRRLAVDCEYIVGKAQAREIVKIGSSVIDEAIRTGDRKLTTQALKLLEAAIFNDPDHPDYPCDRGALFEAAGRFGEADRDFTRAIELAPDTARLWTNRASVRVKSGRFEDAISDATHAIELDRGCAKAYTVRGTGLLAMNKPEPAISDFSVAIELSNYSDIVALANRAKAYNCIGRWPDAIADLSLALKINPKLAAAFDERANAYEHDGQYELAKADRDAAKRLRRNGSRSK